MGWPQYTILGLNALNIGIVLAKHGEPRGNWNFFGHMIDVVIVMSILWAGNFFK